MAKLTETEQNGGGKGLGKGANGELLFNSCEFAYFIPVIAKPPTPTNLQDELGSRDLLYHTAPIVDNVVFGA